MALHKLAMTDSQIARRIRNQSRASPVLNLFGSGIIDFPLEITEQTHLQSVYLDKNSISSIPSAIKNLSKLTSLQLHYNDIEELPPEIGQLHALEYLEIHHNKLSSLPPEIGRLHNLRTLILGSNSISSLPEEIGDLVNLEGLYLSSNEISELPSSLSKLSNLKELNLINNPLPIPPEILRRTEDPAALLSFYKRIKEEETDRLYEAKLLILGEGGAGKTSLARKIQDPEYQLEENELSTDGIDIVQHQFPLDNGKDFRINIWDFGGQQIYHTTHQFFLTKRSLYVLVADARKEDTDFRYWLNIVELLSNDSPLLIIKNEKQDIKLEIDEKQLRREFLNMKDSLATNLADNRGLDAILSAIRTYVTQLPHVGTALPKTWVQVREALDQDSRNTISLDEYLEICQENGFLELKDKLQLSGYLHDLGVCLHFQDDDLLRKTIILNPTWGTDAVYKVLRNRKVTNSQGRFSKDDLAAIWKEDKYVTQRPELLRLMMKFKLCYEIPSQPENYIAPQLLDPNQPDYSWDDADNRLLRYEYEFMPKGILTRFIVENHRWIEDQSCVWRTGVVLKNGDARAEIIEMYRYHKGEIRIRVHGKRKRDLLTTILHEFDKIHHLYGATSEQTDDSSSKGLNYKTFVMCNCKECRNEKDPHLHPLHILRKFLEDDKAIQCPKSYEMVSARSLIDDSFPPKKRLPDKLNQQNSNIGSARDGIRTDIRISTTMNNEQSTSKNDFRGATFHGGFAETVNGSQIGSINNNYGATTDEIVLLISSLRNQSRLLPETHREQAFEIIDNINTEVTSPKPDRKRISSFLKGFVELLLVAGVAAGGLSDFTGDLTKIKENITGLTEIYEIPVEDVRPERLLFGKRSKN